MLGDFSSVSHGLSPRLSSDLRSLSPCRSTAHGSLLRRSSLPCTLSSSCARSPACGLFLAGTSSRTTSSTCDPRIQRPLLAIFFTCKVFRRPQQSPSLRSRGPILRNSGPVRSRSLLHAQIQVRSSLTDFPRVLHAWRSFMCSAPVNAWTSPPLHVVCCCVSSSAGFGSP